MNRKSFLKSILAIVPASLLYPVVANSKSTSSQDYTNWVPCAIDDKPLPNTDKFNIETYVYPHDGHIMYFCPSMKVCSDWLTSFCKIENSYTSTDSGYFVDSRVIDILNYRERDLCGDINGTWGKFTIGYNYSIYYGNVRTMKRNRINVKTGFLDQAAPVYDDNEIDRQKFWNSMKSIYTKI